MIRLRVVRLRENVRSPTHRFGFFSNILVLERWTPLDGHRTGMKSVQCNVM